MKGTVKWFSTEKGYGFITSDKNEDHYFNVQNINGKSLPNNGDIVEFEPAKGEKGPKAINVVISNKASETEQQHKDDRIVCPNCTKKMVPRIITNQGTIDRTVCPFCTTTIEDHSLLGTFFKLFGYAAKNHPVTLSISLSVLVIILFSL